jgi:hypothetical protein
MGSKSFVGAVLFAVALSHPGQDAYAWGERIFANICGTKVSTRRPTTNAECLENGRLGNCPVQYMESYCRGRYPK